MKKIPGRVWILGLVVLSSLLLCILALWRGWVKPDSIQAAVSEVGPWGMVAYVIAVVIMELFWLPRMWGLVAGGMLFGPLLGGSLSIVADLSGGLLCYGIARGSGRQWVSYLLTQRPKARQIVELLAEKRSVPTLAVLRICPAAHYTLVSYVAGLTGVGVSDFLIGTGIGLLPGAVLYPIVGNSALRPGSPAFFISLSIVLLFLVLTLLAGRKLFKT